MNIFTNSDDESSDSEERAPIFSPSCDSYNHYGTTTYHFSEQPEDNATDSSLFSLAPDLSFGSVPVPAPLPLLPLRGSRSVDSYQTVKEPDSPTSDDTSSVTSSCRSAARKIKFYRGIQLKLGKERDSYIRPAITLINRTYREVFRDALTKAGLNYSNLRMWRDSQLCEAIHVADSFRPGIWEAATILHVSKTTHKKRASPRKRRRISLPKSRK